MKKRTQKALTILLAGIVCLLSCTPAFAAGGRWIQSGNRWWYRHSDASYTANGWEKIQNTWYRFDGSGWMQTGWVKDNGTWYYLNANGAMRTGWLKDKDKWYYLNANGAMRTGWLSYKDDWYYLGESGAMLTRAWQGTYYLDETGVWLDNIAFDFGKAVRKIEISYGDVPAGAVRKTTTDSAVIKGILQYLQGLPVAEGEHPLYCGGAYTLAVYYTDKTFSYASISANAEADLYCKGVYYEANVEDVAAFYQQLS